MHPAGINPFHGVLNTVVPRTAHHAGGLLAHPPQQWSQYGDKLAQEPETGQTGEWDNGFPPTQNYHHPQDDYYRPPRAPQGPSA